jgi:hypothetical protein
MHSWERLSEINCNHFNLINNNYKKTTANILSNGEELSVLPIKLGTKKVCPFALFSNFSSAGVQTQGLVHARQVLCHWATTSAFALFQHNSGCSSNW